MLNTQFQPKKQKGSYQKGAAFFKLLLINMALHLPYWWSNFGFHKEETGREPRCIGIKGLQLGPGKIAGCFQVCSLEGNAPDFALCGLGKEN